MMMISDLPHDLESEILSRVPAKSLWELRATCKRWYFLFRDPWFMEKNKIMLGEAVRESMLVSNLRVSSIAGDLHGLHKNGVKPSINLTGKLGSLKGSKDLIFYHLFHCDGLMLCSIKGRNSLLVWNPCTGQRVIIKPRTRYRRDDTYALGYTRSSSSSSPPGHSYKILRYWCYENDFVVECEIYELCSGSWRVLDSFTGDYDLVCDGMSLKGNTYWVAVDKETGFFLMKFDFTTERFVRLPLPFQSLDLEDSAVLSVVKDEKLSVLHQAIHAGSDVMKIWVTNKVDDDDEGLSWRSDFVLTVEFFKIDDIQFVVTVLSFVLDEENKVAVCCDIDPDDDDDKTRIYIVGEDNMYKQVYNDTVQKASGFSLPRVLTYVPRLLQINKRRH